MTLSMSERAAHYELAYIEEQVEEAEGYAASARKRLRFWREMLDAKHSLDATPPPHRHPEFVVSPEVEELARDMFEGFGTRSWTLCTDQHYWHERARKLVEAGWRKTEGE